MYSCANCAVHECSKERKGNLPLNCPMRDETFILDCFLEYKKEENRKFYITSSEIEALGYGIWPRLKEIMEFSKRMGYKKLGLAFCRGVRNEAKIVGKILQKNGFDVESVICKVGGIDKNEIGIECKVHPGTFEPMCNPVTQAKALNRAGTELNIVMGLCVGHDSLFYKYSEALVTTFAVKDRVLAHNPMAAVYCHDGYYSSKLDLD